MHIHVNQLPPIPCSKLLICASGGARRIDSAHATCGCPEHSSSYDRAIVKLHCACIISSQHTLYYINVLHQLLLPTIHIPSLSAPGARNNGSNASSYETFFDCPAQCFLNNSSPHPGARERADSSNATIDRLYRAMLVYQSTNPRLSICRNRYIILRMLYHFIITYKVLYTHISASPYTPQ